MNLTVLLPCLNESETLETCIKKAQASISASGLTGEVLVADNGSSDGSQEIAKSLGARLIHVKQKGYGSALLAGINAAYGENIIMADADDSYALDNLTPFITILVNNGADLVLGNRFAGGISPGAMPFLHRYIGNPVLSFLGRLFFSAPLNDFHCGLRGFKKASIINLGLASTGMEFASEMIVKSQIAGLRITEVPTTLSKDGRSRAPHLRTWRDGWRHLRFLLAYSPRWLFYYPGILLTSLGFIGLIALLKGPVEIAGVVFQTQSLVFSAGLFLFGQELVWLAVLSKASSVSKGLLPKDVNWSKIIRYFGREINLFFYLFIFLSGAAACLFSLLDWQSHDFGPLQMERALRRSILALILTFSGVQAMFFHFLLGVVSIPVKDGSLIQEDFWSQDEE